MGMEWDGQQRKGRIRRPPLLAENYRKRNWVSNNSLGLTSKLFNKESILKLSVKGLTLNQRNHFCIQYIELPHSNRMNIW